MTRSESARKAAMAQLATPELRAAHEERARRNLAKAHAIDATPEGRAAHLARLAEAREKSTLPALLVARTMRAQADAEAFILANNLLARSAQRGHVVGSTGGRHHYRDQRLAPAPVADGAHRPLDFG